MLTWIVVGILIYLLIGCGVLWFMVTSDPYGGLILEYWYLVIFAWPGCVFLAIKNYFFG